MAKYNPLLNLNHSRRVTAADRKAADAAYASLTTPRYVTDDGHNSRAAAPDRAKVLELAKSLSKPFVLDSTYTKVAYCGEANLRLQNLVNQRAQDVVYYGADGFSGRSFVDLLIEAADAYANHITDNEEMLIRANCYHDANTLRAAAALLRLHSVSGVVHPHLYNHPRRGNPAASRFVLLDAGYDEGHHGAHERYTLICTTPQGSGSRSYYNYIGFGPGVSGHGELTASDFRALKAEGFRSLGKRIKVEALPSNHRHLAERFMADC